MLAAFSATQLHRLTKPETLNGFKVTDWNDHGNGYATVCVHMPENAITPYCVATWWPELGNRWSWGHYCNDIDSDDEFNAVAMRNANRAARGPLPSNGMPAGWRDYGYED